MSGPDLYAVLGVAPAATAEELAAAYRQRVRLTHPDAGGDTLAFRAAQGAYEILRDPGLRAGYDAELNGGSASRAAGEVAQAGGRPDGGGDLRCEASVGRPIAPAAPAVQRAHRLWTDPVG